MLVTENAENFAHIDDTDKRPCCLLNRLVVDFMILDTPVIVRYCLLWIPTSVLQSQILNLNVLTQLNGSDIHLEMISLHCEYYS